MLITLQATVKLLFNAIKTAPLTSSLKNSSVRRLNKAEKVYYFILMPNKSPNDSETEANEIVVFLDLQIAPCIQSRDLI